MKWKLEFLELPVILDFQWLPNILSFVFKPLTTIAVDLPFLYLSPVKTRASVLIWPSKALTNRSFISMSDLKQRSYDWGKKDPLFCTSFSSIDKCFLSMFSACVLCWWSPFRVNRFSLTLCQYKTWTKSEKDLFVENLSQHLGLSPRL